MAPGESGHTPRWTQVTAVLSYCLSSLGMLLANKLVLSSYKFTASFFLLAVQCGATVLLLEISRAAGLLSRRDFKGSEARDWFPVSLLLCAMIYTSTMALAHFSVGFGRCEGRLSGLKANLEDYPCSLPGRKHGNTVFSLLQFIQIQKQIPLFTVLKHSTIIAIAFSERFFLNGSPVTPIIMFSFVLMILSAIVAGWDDLRIKTGSDDRWKAYAWMFANCVASAAYSVGIRGAMMKTHFHDFDVVFYNNLLALPLLLGLSVIFEPTAWATWTFSSLPPSAFSASSLTWLVVVTGIASFAISYTTSWSVRAVGSTTTSVAGALNKLPVAIAGMVVFGDPVTVSSVGGVLLAFTAGVIYTHAKSQERKGPALPVVAPKTDLDSPNRKNTG